MHLVSVAGHLVMRSDGSPLEQPSFVGGVTLSLAAAADGQMVKEKAPLLFLEINLLVTGIQQFSTLYIEDNAGALAP
jgi:hypothetical protein